MNRDRIKGTAKDITGKIQRKTGQAMGNSEQEARGMARQLAGKIQKTYGKAVEKLQQPKRTRKV